MPDAVSIIIPIENLIMFMVFMNLAKSVPSGDMYNSLKIYILNGLTVE